MQNGQFPSKIALHLKKVYYKVSLCENCQRQSCKAFIVLTIRAKILGLTDRIGPNSPIFCLFSSVAPHT